jgi:hypothetical protein
MIQIFKCCLCRLMGGDGNVPTLAVRAGFGVINCQATTNDDRSTKLEHSTTPCLAANVCYGLPFSYDKTLWAEYN